MLYLCMTTQPPKSFLLIINKIFSNKYLTTTLLKVHESRSDWTKTFYNTYVNFHFFFLVYLHLIYIIFVTETFYDTRVCFMFEWNTLSGFGQDIIIVRKKKPHDNFYLWNVDFLNIIIVFFYLVNENKHVGWRKIDKWCNELYKWCYEKL